ncbi:hypothetical protein [Clostridium sp. HBUAS56010]|uniref:hypothetical protein n=1 Tax=Clostridium sp. HBUAS56010 TaxID=2571127 RepID=UPI0011776ADB|nr:hypothetical protein [Clostridium sp. HBUAS56010]
MNTAELLQALKENNDKCGMYQIHLNSGNFEDTGRRNHGVEFSDIYFTTCGTIGANILSFGNMNRKPISKKEDGTPLYPMDSSNTLYIYLDEIEEIEDLKDYDDWFETAVSRVINVYMRPEGGNPDGNRDVVTIGFMK